MRAPHRNPAPRGRSRAALALGLLALAVEGGSLPGATAIPPAPVAPAPVPVAAAGPELGFDAELLAVGAQARAEGWPAVRTRLAALERDATRAERARLLAGLLAHAHGDHAFALERLSTATAPPRLDDWRLHVLAEAAAARGLRGRARQALGELLDRYPQSPLREPALVRLAELADQDGDGEAVLRWVARGRQAGLSPVRQLALEQLAWRLAVARRDRALELETARRLLVLAPLEASRLRVVDVVTAHGGPSDWRLWLGPAELVARAAALLDAELSSGALTTLAAVPVAARDLAWRQLEARALIAAGRAAAAYDALASATAADAAGRAALDLTLADAARSAARGVAGRAPAAAERERWRRLERERLLAVARAGSAAPALARDALGRLALAHLEEERLDEALAALRQLAAVAPEVALGARPLWELGWRAYRAGDARRAVAAWAELDALYPRSSAARSGAYWTARAFERLGDAEGARRQYERVANGPRADFYARQAARRLAGAPELPAAGIARADWPADPRLARARLLSDLGLDALAASELELLAGQAEPRAAAALAGLVRARRADRRGSLRELKRAFPELGTALEGVVPAEALPLYYPLDFRASIARAAAARGLPPSLVFGMVHQESGFDPAARSHAGARGLMQLMPGTGREVAQKLGLPYSEARLEDPDYSLRLGTTYFERVLRMFDGNVELALAGYNGGPGRISRWWRAAGPDAELDRFLEELALEESRNYVKRIVTLAAGYRSLYPDLG